MKQRRLCQSRNDNRGINLLLINIHSFPLASLLPKQKTAIETNMSILSMVQVQFHRVHDSCLARWRFLNGTKTSKHYSQLVKIDVVATCNDGS